MVQDDIWIFGYLGEPYAVLVTVLPKSQIQKESFTESLGGIFQNYKAEKTYESFGNQGKSGDIIPIKMCQ